MKKRLHALFILSLALILGGCLAAPNFDEEPYTEDDLGLIAGTTTKREVLQLLGEPGATFEQESVFVYTEFQAQVTVAYVGSFGELHFLLLSFSKDGVLSEYSIESATPDMHGCITSGWCSAHGNRVLRLADAGQDAMAKQFSVANDRCRIYVYGPITPLVAISIDGRSIGGVFSNRYFQFMNVDPGSHRVAIEMQPGEKKRFGMGDLPSISFDCDGDELIFIRLKRGWSAASLEMVSQSEGREQIRKRQLIVSGPMRSIPAGGLNE